MKLLLENWREYLNEQEGALASQNFSAVNLNDPQAMISKVTELGLGKQIPPEFKPHPKGKWPHHMTINMGPLLPGWTSGEPITLTIDGWGMINDKTGQAMAFRVAKNQLPGGVKNAVPHITTLVGPDGKPFQSNKIVNWEDLTSTFDVEGVIVGATPQQKKKKAVKQQRKGPQMPAELRALGGTLRQHMRTVATIWDELQAGTKTRDDLIALGLSDEQADAVMGVL